MATRETKPVRWVDICHALAMTGYMKDFSKGECLRVSKLLMSTGNAEKVKRGLYRLTGDYTLPIEQPLEPASLPARRKPGKRGPSRRTG